MKATALNREQIETLIPQRAPFLFVDRVTELKTDKVVASYLAEPSAPYFEGHYPGNPVMPGVLMCESAFQAGALLIAHRDGPSTGGTPVLTRVRDARFKRIVRPGDELRIEVSFEEDLGDAYYMLGRVFTHDKLALRVEFAVMLAEGTQA